LGALEKLEFYQKRSDEEFEEDGITLEKINTSFALLQDRTEEEKQSLIINNTSYLDFVNDIEKQKVLREEVLNKYQQKLIILSPDHLPNFDINKFREKFDIIYEIIKHHKEKEVFEFFDSVLGRIFLKLNPEILDLVFNILQKQKETSLESLEQIISFL
jgi:hypothetical protein